MPLPKLTVGSAEELSSGLETVTEPVVLLLGTPEFPVAAPRSDPLSFVDGMSPSVQAASSSAVVKRARWAFGSFRFIVVFASA